MDDICPFCVRIYRGDVDDRVGGVVHFEPLHPVTPGHRLFLPATHVEWDHPAAVLELRPCVAQAARYAKAHGWWFNIITSYGAAATQTVPHLHVHLVPRTEGDGLRLPWGDQ